LFNQSFWYEHSHMYYSSYQKNNITNQFYGSNLNNIHYFFRHLSFNN